eukprot:TRINITY_DN55596_c0_g1_i1.p1 TRINITY_DN55596_c0_g1~~TRINITY_DN55596_c0_g1_i1.p1  ORF type:complete len:612 (+),score=99.91 TRINITY_DN55596_c0_g1_i1:61-1836(+)
MALGDVPQHAPAETADPMVTAADEERCIAILEDLLAAGQDALFEEVGLPQKVQVYIGSATGLNYLAAEGKAAWIACEVKQHQESQGSQAACETRSIRGESDPVWDETHELAPWHVGEPLEFCIYSKGVVNSRIEGRARISSGRFYPDGFDGNLPIAGLDNSMLRVRVMPESSQLSPAQARSLRAMVQQAEQAADALEALGKGSSARHGSGSSPHLELIFEGIDSPSTSAPGSPTSKSPLPKATAVDSGGRASRPRLSSSPRQPLRPVRRASEVSPQPSRRPNHGGASRVRSAIAVAAADVSSSRQGVEVNVAAGYPASPGGNGARSDNGRIPSLLKPSGGSADSTSPVRPQRSRRASSPIRDRVSPRPSSKPTTSPRISRCSGLASPTSNSSPRAANGVTRQQSNSAAQLAEEEATSALRSVDPRLAQPLRERLAAILRDIEASRTRIREQHLRILNLQKQVDHRKRVSERLEEMEKQNAIFLSRCSEHRHRIKRQEDGLIDAARANRERCGFMAEDVAAEHQLIETTRASLLTKLNQLHEAEHVKQELSELRKHVRVLENKKADASLKEKENLQLFEMINDLRKGQPRWR